MRASFLRKSVPDLTPYARGPKLYGIDKTALSDVGRIVMVTHNDQRDLCAHEKTSPKPCVIHGGNAVKGKT